MAEPNYDFAENIADNHALIIISCIVMNRLEECNEREQYTNCERRQLCLYPNNAEDFCSHNGKHCCKLCQKIREDISQFQNQRRGKSERRSINNRPHLSFSIANLHDFVHILCFVFCSQIYDN